MTNHSPERLFANKSTVVLNDLILRSIVDYAIVTLDASGIITSWNEGAERVLGWTEEEAVGQHASIFFTRKDTEESRPEVEMAGALENGRAEDERWHIRKDGQKFWGSGLMMPLLAATDPDGDAAQAEGSVEGFVKIFRDGTLDHRRNNTLSKMENQAALAVRKSGTVGIFDYDLLDDIIVADPVNAAMHGVSVTDARQGTSVEAFFDGVVPEDQPRVRKALAKAVEQGNDLHVTYRVNSPDSRPRWVLSQSSAQRDGDGRVARLSGIVTDVTMQREEVRMQEARLRFSDQVRGLTDQDAITHLASSVIAETLYASRVGYAYVDPDGDEIDIRADWTLDNADSIVGAMRFSDFGSFGETLRKGEKVIIEDVRRDDRIEDSKPIESFNIRSLVYLPMMHDGRLKAVLFVNNPRPRIWSESELAFLQSIFDRADTEIERSRADAQRDIMSAELAHRMKNMLSIAQVIVNQSLRQVGGLDAERNAIAGRLNALGDAQDVLTTVNNQDAGIRSVIEAVLRPHDIAGRIAMKGSSMMLNSQQVLGLSLALHELATNAAKYGALCGDDGRVEIEWTHKKDGPFKLVWNEIEGPPVTPPKLRGFGSTILDKITGRYFNGTSQVEFEPSGIVFTIEGQV